MKLCPDPFLAAASNLRLPLAAFGLMLSQMPASAANYWWNATGANTWATGSMWSNNFYTGGTTGTVPTASDIAIFNQSGLTAAATTANLAADASVSGLVFNNVTGGTIIQSPTNHKLILGSSGILINSGASAVTFGDGSFVNFLGAVQLDANQSWINNASTTFTLNSNVQSINASRALTIGGTGATTMVIGLKDNGANLTSLVKNGTGILSLNDAVTGTGAKFTLTGGITANAGKVLINGTASSSSGQTNVVSSQALTLGGGALVATWANTSTSASNSQTFTGTTLNAGASTIGANNSSSGASTTKNAAVILGAITRNAGSTVNFSATGNATGADKLYIGSSSFGASQIVLDSGVAYATAVASTTSNISPSSSSDNWAFTNASGRIDRQSFAASYTTVAGGGTLAAATNADVTGSPLATNDVALTSLRFSTAASTITINGGQTLTTGGILIASTAGASSTITGGTLKSAATAANKDLVIINNGSGYLDLTGTVIANATAGATGLTKSGGGGLILGAANSYSGPTYINGGYLAINSDGTGATNSLGAYQGSVTANAISLNGGGLLLNAAGSDTSIGANRGLTLGGNGGILYSGTGRTLTIDGVITSASGASTANSYGALTINNASNRGTVVLGGNNTFVGGVAINGGTLQLAASNPGALNSTAGSENVVTMAQNNTTAASSLAGAGSVLTLNGNSVTIGDLKGSGAAGAFAAVVQNANASNATLTIGNSQNLGGGTSASPNSVFNGVIQDGSGVGTLALVKTGTGSLKLEPSIVRSGAWGAAGAAGVTVTVTGVDTSFLKVGTALTGITGGSTIASIIDGSSFTFTSTAAVTAGSGNLSFSQRLNTYTGGTFVKNGTLTVGSTALPFASAVTLGDSSTNTSGVLYLTGSNTISSMATAGSGGLNNLVTANTAVTLTNNGGNQTFDGTMGGTSFAFAYTGAGTLSLGGRLSNTGATTIGSGSTIKLTNANVLGTSGDATTAFRNTNTNGTLTLQYAAGATLNANTKVDLTVNTSNTTTLAVSLDGNNQTFASLNLGQKNTMNVSSTTGTAVLNVTGSTTMGVGTSGSVSQTIAPSSGASVILGAVTGNASGGSQINTLVLDGTTTGNQITGIISDVAAGPKSAITKSNSSTWTLSGTGSYTGATAIDGGKLIMGDDAADTFATSGVTVASGATLGGSGTITKPGTPGTLGVTGILAPGIAGVSDGIGTLAAGTTTWNGAATSSADTIWQFDLGASSGSSDKLAITGDFKKTGAGTPFYEFNFMGSAPNAWGNTYTLLTWTGATDFTSFNQFSWTGLSGSYSGLDSYFTLTGVGVGTGGSLTFTAVPEPTSALAGLLITAGLLRRRRRIG